MVDLGAGTGKLTRLLVPSGARVSRSSRSPRCARSSSRSSRAPRRCDGTAEAIPLPDGERRRRHGRAGVPLVRPRTRRCPRSIACCGRAARSRSSGTCAISTTRCSAAVEDLLAPIRHDVPGPGTRARGAIRSGSRLCSAPAVVGTFHYEQRFTADDLCDRVASTSFVAAMTPGRPRGAARASGRSPHGLDEPFPFRYVTEVHVIPRSSDAGARRAGYLDRGIARRRPALLQREQEGERDVGSAVRSARRGPERTAAPRCSVRSGVARTAASRSPAHRPRRRRRCHSASGT